MLRHVATAAMRRLATPGGSGVRAFAGHNARWRAAFSSEGEGQDGESAADASTSESSVQDSAAEGADAAVDAAAEPAADAPSTSDDARAGDADGDVAPGVRFTGDKYESIELKAETPDGEDVKMTAVRPLLPADESLMEKDGWLYDMTEQGHTVHNNPNIRNAHLSDRTKTQMYMMHLRDPKTWDVARLAEQYKIRQQRVMAILALKKLQQQHLNEGKDTFPHLEAAWEEIHGSEDRGSGERHVRIVPELPKFQVVHANTSPEELDAILPKYESPEAKAEKEERVLIRRFRDNLAYNARETAPSLNRRGRIRRPHARPPGGWGLMVVPMVESNSKKTHARAKREGWRVEADAPYVAYPDGTKREANEDEKVMFARRRARPFRKIV
jgi:hypothetical protein